MLAGSCVFGLPPQTSSRGLGSDFHSQCKAVPRLKYPDILYDRNAKTIDKKNESFFIKLTKEALAEEKKRKDNFIHLFLQIRENVEIEDDDSYDDGLDETVSVG